MNWPAGFGVEEYTPLLASTIANETVAVSPKGLIHPLLPFPTLLGRNGLFRSPVVRGLATVRLALNKLPNNL